MTGAPEPGTIEIAARVNGREVRASVDPRLLLSDFVRHGVGLTGTHVGCEQGACGACTLLVNGAAIRSCLMFAVQADGTEVETVESLQEAPGELAGLQAAFHRNHALQCGFCTPGFLLSIKWYLDHVGLPESDAEIRSMLSGNLCRCTGYQNIVAAVREFVGERRGA